MTERRVTTAKNQAVNYRNYRRARDRALAALAQQYPDDYKQLLEREKARDEQEGRKWLDIDGTTSAVGLRPTTTAESQHEAGDNRAYKSNYGGEA